MNRNLDVTNWLVRIAVIGYVFTGFLTYMEKADVSDFHDLTSDVLLAVIAFGKVENARENREKDDEEPEPKEPESKDQIRNWLDNS